jgi:hypothetical protein
MYGLKTTGHKGKSIPIKPYIKYGLGVWGCAINGLPISTEDTMVMLDVFSNISLFQCNPEGVKYFEHTGRWA